MNPPSPPTPAEHRAPSRRRRIAWAVLVMVTVLGGATLALRHRLRAAAHKAALDQIRQIEWAATQHAAEWPYRIFVRRDEIFGPRGHIQTFTTTAGDLYDDVLPFRRDNTEAAPLVAADGRRLPAAPLRLTFTDGSTGYYRLHGGSATPPPDGAYTRTLASGARFELTYRGGVPHGVVRAFLPDGSPWGESRYENGRQTGPAWLILHDGRKLDELADGRAAHAAFVASRAAR